MTYAPPSRCPGCGALYTLTLISDPGTPVYACGSTPSRIVCTMLRPSPVDAIANVAPPTGADLDDLARMLGALSANGYAAPPRVTWCTAEGCGAAAIDGLCNDHWNDDVISVGLAALA